MKKTILFCIGILCMMTVFAQVPNVEFFKSYGGNFDDDPYFVQQTADGGYIIAGTTISDNLEGTNYHGERDIYIVKTDSHGTLEWQKTFGGSNVEIPFTIQQTFDNGYIVCGLTNSTDGDITNTYGLSDCWVLKLAADGTIEWQKSYGGSGSDDAFSIQQTTDGGYIIAALTTSTDGDVTFNHGNSDIWIIKIDADGIIAWQKTYGGSSGEQPTTIKQTSDGGYVVTGTTSSSDGDVSNANGNCWVLKLDDLGTIEWQKTLPGTPSERNSIEQCIDNGYILAIGVSQPLNGFNHTVSQVVKLYSTGAIEWQKTFSGPDIQLPEFIHQTSEGGYFFSYSRIYLNHGNYYPYDPWILKLNSTGTVEWQRSFSADGFVSRLYAVQTADGGYIVTGTVPAAEEDDPEPVHNYNEIGLEKLECVPITSNISHVACNSYTWHGTTYTASGTYTYVSTTTGGCTNTENLDLTITPTPATPGLISGPYNACPFVGTGAGTTATYSITAVPNAATYRWTLPANVTVVSATADSTSITVSFGAGYAAGPDKTFMVQSVSACGNSSASSLLVLVTQPGIPSLIKAETSDVCSFVGTTGSVRYSVNELAGFSYQWTLPAHSVIDSGLNGSAIRIRFLTGYSFTTGDSLSVQKVAGCGTSAPRRLAIKAIVPETPSLIKAETSNVCSFVGTAGSVRYSVNAIPGVTYQWTLPANSVIDSGSNGNAIRVRFLAGYSFIPGDSLAVQKISACGSSLPRRLAIKTILPSAPAGIASTLVSNACGARVYRYTAAVVSAATGYAWSLPAAMGASVDSGDVNSSRIIRIKYTSNAASASTDSVFVISRANCGTSLLHRGLRLNIPAKSGCSLKPLPAIILQPEKLVIKDSKTSKPSVTGASLIKTNTFSAITKASVYPNPNQGEFTVSISTTEKAGYAMIQLFDLTNRLITERKVAVDKNGILLTRFTTHGLAQGIYLVRYNIGEISGTIRVIIAR